jgi:hypothetical protein
VSQYLQRGERASRCLRQPFSSSFRYPPSPHRSVDVCSAVMKGKAPGGRTTWQVVTLLSGPTMKRRRGRTLVRLSTTIAALHIDGLLVQLPHASKVPSSPGTGSLRRPCGQMYGRLFADAMPTRFALTLAVGAAEAASFLDVTRSNSLLTHFSTLMQGQAGSDPVKIAAFLK